MKLVKNIFIFVFCFISLSLYVNAGSASLSVNRSSIENGGSVTATVSLSGVAAWNVRITSSGATSGCTQGFADATSDGNNANKSFSVTCKATSTGIINFTLSGDVTSSDGSNSKVSGSKQVTVVAPRQKSSNNKLKSLSVSDYEISPKFSQDVNEYSVTVPSTVEKITINATKADSYSKIDGTGEKTVEEGVNTFEVVVTSETGVSNTYKLTVNVEDVNPIEVTVDGKKYTVVKIAKNLEKPELFDETTIKIGDVEIPAFKNDLSKYTLVGLKDESGNISLFVYNNGKYSKYNEFRSDSLAVIFMDMKKIPKESIKTKIKMNEKDVVAYRIKKDNKIILYGMNIANGKENYYSYDSSEKTLQKFDIDKYNKQLIESKQNMYLIYGLALGMLILFIILILVLSRSHKLKKMVELKNDFLK